MKAGDKVYVPKIDKVVTVLHVNDNNKPVYGKYTDTNGKIQIITLINTAWEFISTAKALWLLIKAIFKIK